jgi:hypothetical protein
MTPPTPHPAKGLHHLRLGATARQALVVLAESPEGRMEEPLLLTCGVKPKLIAGRVDAGLATKTAERRKDGAAPYQVWIKITDAGRKALGR